MTIKDVAEYCGVSITTVSRVLNNHPDVRESVRARVMQAVRDLHYVPNSSARDLGKSQTDTIGVVLRGATNPFLTAVLRSVEQAVDAAGYDLALQQIGTNDDEVAAGAALVRSNGCAVSSCWVASLITPLSVWQTWKCRLYVAPLPAVLAV